MPIDIPGYEGGPFTNRPQLLDNPLFWEGHLHNYAQDELAEELLHGEDDSDAATLFNSLLTGPEWPVFTVPLADGHRLHVVYRAFEEDEGVDYLVHHPTWDKAELITADEGCFRGPGLSWPELIGAADNGIPGGSTDDPDARLLLLIPALGDTALPTDATPRLTTALATRTQAADPEGLAAALLETQGYWTGTDWSHTEDGTLISTGKYALRHTDARPAAALTRIATALAPASSRHPLCNAALPPQERRLREHTD
jgi:hypothetical protein